MSTTALLTAEATSTTQATIRRVVKMRTEHHARQLTGGNLDRLTDQALADAFEAAVLEVADRHAVESGRTLRTSVEVIRQAFAAA